MADSRRKRLREEDGEHESKKRCELSNSFQAEYDQQVIEAYQEVVTRSQQYKVVVIETQQVIPSPGQVVNNQEDKPQQQTPCRVQVDSQPDITTTEDSQCYLNDDDDDDDDLLGCSLSDLLTKTPTRAPPPAEKIRTPTPPPPKCPITIAAAAAASQPIVSELEHYIKYEVPFPSKDFIIARKDNHYYPMVRITDITVLNASMQEQLKASPKLYFPHNGQLAENLYLQITAKGSSMNCWLVTPSCKSSFDGKRPKPVLNAMAISNKRRSLLHDAMQEADAMHARALDRERASAAKLAQDEEEAKQLKQTITFDADNKPVIAATVAAAVERTVQPVAFYAGMQLEVIRYLQKVTKKKIIEITPAQQEGDKFGVIRLDNDWCLCETDCILAGANDRAYTLKDFMEGDSTFQVGSTDEETDMQKQMRTREELRIKLQETAKEQFPEFASMIQKPSL